MIVKIEKRNKLTLEYEKGKPLQSIESLSETCLEVTGDVIPGLDFMKFTPMPACRAGAIPEAHWIPLDETLARYRIAIRGPSKVLKGDLLRECVS